MTTGTIPSTPAPSTPAPAPASPAGGAAPELFSTVIPEEYRDKPYLKDFLSKPVGPETYKELFKKVDGLETVVGKKSVGIPAADAKPEDWEAFRAKLRPETPDAYDFPVGKDADPVFLKDIKETFHAAGVEKGQAAKIVEGLKKAIDTQNAGLLAAQKAHNDEFDAMRAKLFGAEHDKVMANSKAMLEENAPAAVKPFINDLDNKALIVMAGVLDSLKKRYGVEDTIDGGEGNANNADAAALQAEGLKLLADPAFKDFTDPRHAEVVARKTQVFAALGKMKK